MTLDINSVNLSLGRLSRNNLIPIDIGKREPICPYCNNPLPEMPKKEIKCPSCNNKIHIWTDRFLKWEERQKSKALLTTEQVSAYDGFKYVEENNGFEVFLNSLLEDESAFYEQLHRLEIKFKPSLGDVLWGMLISHMPDHMDIFRAERFGANLLITAGRFDKRCYLLWYEGKYRQAFENYLIYCYGLMFIDCEYRITEDSPRDIGRVRTWVLDALRYILKYPIDDIEIIFKKSCSRYEQADTLSVNDAWEYLKPQIGRE